MNPDLQKLMATLGEASRAAAAAGEPPFTREEIDGWLLEQSGGKFNSQGPVNTAPAAGGAAVRPTPQPLGRGIARAFTQGLTSKFGDELGLVDPQAEAAFKAERPFVAGAAEMAGAVAPFLAGPGGALTRSIAASTVPKMLLKTAGLGAAEGALAGAGGADAGNRTGAAVVGGVVGGALSPVIPGIAAAGSLLRPAATRAQQSVRGAVERSGGVQKMLDRVEEFRKAGRGDQVMLLDLSDKLRSAADFAANASDEAAEVIGGRTAARQMDNTSRLVNDVEDIIGQLPDAAQRKELLALSKRTWAESDVGYGGLRRANPDLSGVTVAGRLPGGGVVLTQEGRALGEIINQPAVAEAFKQANRTGQIGAIKDSGAPSFQMLQDVKESLDDMASRAFRAGSGNEGRALASARDQVVEWMTRNVPSYSGVAEEYARRSGLENAVDLGVNFWNTPDSRGLLRMVNTLKQQDPSAVKALQEGLASEFVTKLRAASTNRDLAKQLLDGLGGVDAARATKGGARPAMLDKLELVFGSQRNLDVFLKRAGIEKELAKARGVTAGSATARRQMAQDAAGSEAAAIGVATGAAGWGVASAIQALGRWAGQKATRAVAGGMAREMGPTLATQGADDVSKFLRSLQATPPPRVVGRGAVTAGAVAPRGILQMFDQ
jgi:hypothetical protein